MAVTPILIEPNRKGYGMTLKPIRVYIGDSNNYKIHHIVQVWRGRGINDFYSVITLDAYLYCTYTRCLFILYIHWMLIYIVHTLDAYLYYTYVLYSTRCVFVFIILF